MDLIVAYKRHAEAYYRKNGQVTNEVAAILSASKVVKQLYGREPASSFDALKLQAVQQAMIRLGWCRRQINKQISRIVRMFAWGVSQKLVRGDMAHELREVKGLHHGRTQARESKPVLPVDDGTVNATLEHLPPLVADMVRLQRLTGCRPEEVCLIRPCDVDRGAIGRASESGPQMARDALLGAKSTATFGCDGNSEAVRSRGQPGGTWSLGRGRHSGLRGARHGKGCGRHGAGRVITQMPGSAA